MFVLMFRVPGCNCKQTKMQDNMGMPREIHKANCVSLLQMNEVILVLRLDATLSGIHVEHPAARPTVHFQRCLCVHHFPNTVRSKLLHEDMTNAWAIAGCTLVHLFTAGFGGALTRLCSNKDIVLLIDSSRDEQQP